MANKAQLILIATYCVLIVLNLIEGQRYKALYWFGATLINLAILKMKG